MIKIGQYRLQFISEWRNVYKKTYCFIHPRPDDVLHVAWRPSSGNRPRRRGRGNAPGRDAAEGETRQAATPTDLQPAEVSAELPVKSALREFQAAGEVSGKDKTDAAVSMPQDMTPVVFAAEPDLQTALTAKAQQEAEPVLMQAAAPVSAQQAAGKEAAPAEEKPASLQEIILEKIKAAVSLDGILTVSLPVNTVFEGDVTISKEKGKTYGKNFGIDLQAEGNGDDHLQADGTTVLNRYVRKNVQAGPGGSLLGRG